MNYSYMKVFYTVAKYQNISYAAKELDVSQPAVSRIISNIEKRYNTRLFLRSKSGVTLTREGLNLYEKIKNPLIELEKIENSIGDVINLRETTIYIGATATALYCYLFNFLETIKKRFSLVNFRIYTDSSSNLLEMLEKGSIDFAFITTPFESNEELEIHNVNMINTILIAPISYQEKIKGEIHLSSLVKYPFILLNKEMQFREHINVFLNNYGVKIKPAYEIDSSSTLIPLVENDCGLAFVPDTMAKKSIEDHKCFKVDLLEKIPDRYVSFVMKKSTNNSSIIYDIKTAILENSD